MILSFPTYKLCKYKRKKKIENNHVDSKIYGRSVSLTLHSMREKSKQVSVELFSGANCSKTCLASIRKGLIFVLCFIQIFFIYFDKYKIPLNDDQFPINFCFYFDIYLFEEFIYFVFVVVILLAVFIFSKKRRFNKYIMSKYKHEINNDLLEEEIVTERSVFRIIVDKFKQFPSPSLPYSTSNRKISAAVYAIYTYDTLSIFMSVYTDNISSSFLISTLSDASGVIIDFLFQILQTLLIGFKFYPVLIVTDLNSNCLTYFLLAFYLNLIWFIKLFQKTFCRLLFNYNYYFFRLQSE